jgi:hypothetical protein
MLIAANGMREPLRAERLLMRTLIEMGVERPDLPVDSVVILCPRG